MDEKKAERRRHPRVKNQYRAVVRDSLARVAATGVTEDVSAGGFLLVCGNAQYVPRSGRLFVELTVPDEKGSRTHTERYTCRVAHVHPRADGKLALGIEIVGRSLGAAPA